MNISHFFLPNLNINVKDYFSLYLNIIPKNKLSFYLNKEAHENDDDIEETYNDIDIILLYLLKNYLVYPFS